MKNVAIIGASGFVGPYLVQEFTQAGYSVFPVDLPEVDILKRETLDAFFTKVKPDFVVNLAAISSVGASWNNPGLTVQVNVNGSLNILDSLVSVGLLSSRILLVGSSEQYAPCDRPILETDPLLATNPYGVSKIAQENFSSLYQKKYGLKIINTRSFNHTGVRQSDQFVIPSFCKQVAEIDKRGVPGKIAVGNLSAYRDISDVRDVVHVYRMLLEEDQTESIFNVGSGKVHCIKDLLDYILSLSSCKIEVVEDPARMRPVENPYLCCNPSRIERYWGGRDLKDTIREMFLYFKEH